MNKLHAHASDVKLIEAEWRIYASVIWAIIASPRLYLVQIMPCPLVGAKLLSETMLEHCRIEP